MARRFSTEFQRDASEHNTFVQGLGSIGTDSGPVITGGRAGVLTKNIPASTPIQTLTRSSSSSKQHRPPRDNAPGPVRQQRSSNEYRPYSFTSDKHKDKRKSSYLERNTSVSTHLDKWRTEIPTRPTTQVPILPIIRITTGPAASASAVSQNSTRIFSSGRTPFEAAMEKLMDPDEATTSIASSKRAISDNWRLGISAKPTTQVPIPPIIRITTGPAASQAPRNSMRGYSSGLSPFKAAMDKLRNPDKAAQNAQMAPPHRNSSQLAHPCSPNEPIQTTQTWERLFQRNSQNDCPSSPNDMKLMLRIRDTVCAFPYINDIPHSLDDMRRFKFTIAKGSDIYGHLKMTMPYRDWSSEGIFYFPGCVHQFSTNAQHFLAFGPHPQQIPSSDLPKSRYASSSFAATNHVIRSRFQHLYGTICELFVNRPNGYFCYAGTYKMYALDYLMPDGIDRPDYVPRVFPNIIELEALYKTGALKVECAALQLVGFDESIYRAVKRVQTAKVPPKPAKYLLKLEIHSTNEGARCFNRDVPGSDLIRTENSLSLFDSFWYWVHLCPKMVLHFSAIRPAQELYHNDPRLLSIIFSSCRWLHHSNQSTWTSVTSTREYSIPKAQKGLLARENKSESVSSIRIKPSDWEGVPDPSETAIQSETAKGGAHPNAKGGARYHYEQEFWIMLPPIEQEHQEKHYLGTISWDSDERRISGDIRDADDNTKVLVEVKDGVLSGPKQVWSVQLNRVLKVPNNPYSQWLKITTVLR
ncbi:hypothetical protein EV359DRAFT_62750 [Lentinula novae-zelandiae]|nr:hypothetical protein EV359DRAFT_62750 [Lentinula novae-zelandiae]